MTFLLTVLDGNSSDPVTSAAARPFHIWTSRTTVILSKDNRRQRVPPITSQI